MGNCCKPTAATKLQEPLKGHLSFQGYAYAQFKVTYFECEPANVNGHYPFTLHLDTKQHEPERTCGTLKGCVRLHNFKDVHEARAELGRYFADVPKILVYCDFEGDGVNAVYYTVVHTISCSKYGIYLGTLGPQLEF